MLSDEDLRKLGEALTSLAKVLAQIGIPATAAAVMTRYGLPKIEELLKKGKSEKEALEELLKIIRSSPEYQQSLQSDYEKMLREALLSNPEILSSLSTRSVATGRRPPEVEIEIKSLLDKLSKLNEELTRIDIEHLRGKISDEEFQSIKTKISQMIEETKARLRTLEAAWK